MSGMSAGLGDEMSSIPLGKIIGGPLMATVKAQGQRRQHRRFLQESCMDDHSDAPSWDSFTTPIPAGQLYPLERIMDLMPHGFIQGRQTRASFQTATIP